MIIVLILLSIVVVVLGVRARKSPALKLPAVIAAVLAGGLAAYHVFTSSPDPHLPIDVPPEEALGYVLAQRMLEDVPGGGKVIVFRPETDDPRLVTIYSARMDGINRALAGSFEVVSSGPLLRYGSQEDRQAWLQMEMGFPLEAFRQWAGDHADAVAAISLLGMPVGRLSANTGLPPMYVAELRGVAWDPNRLPAGIKAVVTYRSDRELDQTRTKELLSVFEQNFALYPAVEKGEPQQGGE
jgi:hypothetical protein